MESPKTIGEFYERAMNSETKYVEVSIIKLGSIYHEVLKGGKKMKELRFNFPTSSDKESVLNHARITAHNLRLFGLDTELKDYSM